MRKPKYLHYRHYDKQGVVEAKRGATVAYDEYPDGTLRFAVARVHHRDNFSRSTGRRVAMIRLNDLQRQCFFMVEHAGDFGTAERRHEFLRYMDEQMQSGYGYLRRARAR